MICYEDVPKLGSIVQIKHGGLYDWVTIKVISEPIERGHDYGIEVEYINPPHWLLELDPTDNNGVSYQWNLQEAQIRPVPLTNEQVLKAFLKKHRILTKYRYNVKHFNGGTPTPVKVVTINNPISGIFDWYSSMGGTYLWISIDSKWIALVKHFNLEGTIDTSKI